MIFCSIGLEQPGGLNGSCLREQRCPGCKKKKKREKEGKGRNGGKRKKGERASIGALAPRGEIIDSAVKIIERKRASRCLPGRRAIQSRGTPARNRDNGTRHEPPTSSTATVYPLRGGSLSLSATGHLIDAFVSTFSRSIHPRRSVEKSTNLAINPSKKKFTRIVVVQSSVQTRQKYHGKREKFAKCGRVSRRKKRKNAKDSTNFRFEGIRKGIFSNKAEIKQQKGGK